MVDALRDRRVHRVLADVSFGPMIVSTEIFILRQPPPLEFVDVSHIPRPRNDFSTTSHGLRIRRHHTDRSNVVQNVLGPDRLGADPGLGERNVFRDVFREVVARHGHVEVLFDRVGRVGTCRVGAAWQDVGLLDQRDQIWGVAAACAFDVVGVDCAPFEGCCGLLDEAGFV